MSEQPQAAPPAATAEGFFGRAERAVEHVLPHATAALEDAARVAPELAAAVKDHAGVVFDVAGDVLAVLKAVDPADAPAISAAQALVPKVLAMAESAAKLAGQLHNA